MENFGARNIDENKSKVACCSLYVKDIHKLQFENENKLEFNSTYIRFHPFFSEEKRALFIDQIFHFCDILEFSLDTAFFSINLMDQFLIKTNDPVFQNEFYILYHLFNYYK